MTVRLALTAAPRHGALILVVLTTVVLTLVGAVPAGAHARLLETDPANGAIVPNAPVEVTLTFDEPVELRDGAVRVFDPAGAELDVTGRAVDATVVIALPPDLVEGSYVVNWRVISVDTHPVAGGMTFSVGAPSDNVVAAQSVEPSPTVTAAGVVVQALAYLGLLGAVGLVVFRMLVLPPDQRDTQSARRLHRPATVGAVVAVACLIVLLPLTSARQAGSDLTALADVGAWSDQLTAAPGITATLVAVGMAVALLTARRTHLGPLAAGVTLSGAALALSALAIVGHTRSFGPAWLILPTHLLHVTTAAVWFGGLVGLGIVLAGVRLCRPAGPGTARAPHAVHSSPDQAAAAVARFSTTAAGLVALLSVAGILLGWRIVGSWSALFGTGYGITLLAKAGLVGIVVAVAGFNRYRLLPRLRRTAELSYLRRTMFAETAVIVAVLGLTGLLVHQDPIDPATAGEAEHAAGITVEQDLGDGAVQLRITPAAVGTNALELELTDADGHPLDPAEDPRVRLSLPDAGLGPIERPVDQTGHGSYEVTGDFPLAGEWLVEISVRISRFDEPVIQIPIQMQ